MEKVLFILEKNVTLGERRLIWREEVQFWKNGLHTHSPDFVGTPLDGPADPAPQHTLFFRSGVAALGVSSPPSEVDPHPAPTPP